MSTPHLDSVRLELCDALSSEPAVITKLANHLQDKGLITESTRRDVIGTQGVKPYDQATKLADAVILRLNNPQNATANWHKFLEALKCCGLGDLVESLALQKSNIQSNVITAVTFSIFVCACACNVPLAHAHTPVCTYTYRYVCVSFLKSKPVQVGVAAHVTAQLSHLLTW